MKPTFAPPARTPSDVLAEARDLQARHGTRLIMSAIRRLGRRFAD